jgi:hypothetical protein
LRIRTKYRLGEIRYDVLVCDQIDAIRVPTIGLGLLELTK